MACIKHMLSTEDSNSCLHINTSNCVCTLCMIELQWTKCFYVNGYESFSRNIFSDRLSDRKQIIKFGWSQVFSCFETLSRVIWVTHYGLNNWKLPKKDSIYFLTIALYVTKFMWLKSDSTSSLLCMICVKFCKKLKTYKK